MARRVVIFDTFDKGEYGRLEAWRAPKGSWTGRNMLVYETGEIGVRPGLKLVPVSGLVAGAVGFIETPLASSRLVFNQGTAVRSFNHNDGSGLATAAAALAATPSATQAPVLRTTSFMYLSIRGDKTYQIDASGGTPVVTALTGSPGGHGVAQVGDRLLVANTTAGVNILRYSAAADFNSWPTANVIRVGNDNDSINGMYLQRTHLLISKNEGFYSITGVPGVNETLRPLTTTPGAATSRRGEIDPKGVFLYKATDFDSPAFFNGSYEDRISHLNVENVSYVKSVRPLRDVHVLTSTGANVDTADALIRLNEAWTQHTLGGVNPSFQGHMLADATSSNGTDGASNLILCDGGDGSTVPNFYWLRLNQNHPGIETENFQRAGDNSDSAVVGNFSLPEWHSDEGSEIDVRGVIVDFRKWNTGASTDNSMDVRVESIRTYDNGARTSETLGWDEPNNVVPAGTGGVLDRIHFSLGDQGKGNGFQLHFENLKGVAIRRIQVVIESSSVRL